MQNFSFLACLEVAKKFVVLVGWGGVGWSMPSLGFTFSQAEQNDQRLMNFNDFDNRGGLLSLSWDLHVS